LRRRERVMDNNNWQRLDKGQYKEGRNSGKEREVGS
jgi:hypothetical protein